MIADVRCQERISDVEVFKASELRRMLIENTMGTFITIIFTTNRGVVCKYRISL